MNTNEAIEFLCSIQWDGEKAVYNAINAHKLCQLLKQGEAYKAMWEAFKKIRCDDLVDVNAPDNINTDTEIDVVEILREIDMFEQKYLKEANPTEPG